jgi:hypothetical protein
MESKLMNASYRRRQGGLALPVMLIMLAVMLVSSIYLLRSGNVSTMAASNLAYDSALSKAADLGLHAGFQWLSDSALTNKLLLDADNPGAGYVATLNTNQSTADAAFWAGSIVLPDSAGNSIEYVVHRMCALPGRYNGVANTCVLTVPNPSAPGPKSPFGASLGVPPMVFAPPPQLHYVVTARIRGVRGANVVNQAVVMIGA